VQLLCCSTFFFFSSRRRHTRLVSDWSSDVCSSDLGSGVFLVFGIIARRGAAAGALADPVPQALVITGIVVAFAATALAVALMVRSEERRVGKEGRGGWAADG